MRQRLGREWLDEDHGSAAAVRASLADLAWIHRRLGGETAMRRLLADWLERARREGGLPRRLRILDAGAGAGAGTAELLAWLRAQGIEARLTALDRQASHLAAGRPWPAEAELVAGDLFTPPLRARSFDLVIASLFLHHFHGPAAVRLLRQLAALSRGAVIVHDLERSWLGYAGFSLIAALRLSPMTRHDGRVSFRQAYTAPELAELARKAGFQDAAQPPNSGRSRWSHPKARRCASGTPGSLRLGSGTGQRTPAGAHGVSEVPRFAVTSPGRFRLGLTLWPRGESNGG